MMIRIGLDPSAQYHNRGLDGYIEAYGAWEIAMACWSWLARHHNNRCEVVMSRDSVESLRGFSNYLHREIGRLNQNDCDIAVAIHTDAGGGRGITCFKGGAASEKLGQCLLDALDGATNIPLRQNKPIYHYRGPNYLAVIRETLMPTVLIECGFHDHREDMKVIGTAAGREAIGKALAFGIADYFGWAEQSDWEVWHKDKRIECNVRAEGGTARAALRPLCEALGFSVEVVDHRILIAGGE